MNINRDYLVSDLVASTLHSARIGVVLRGITGVDPVTVATIASQKLGRRLYLSYVGNYHPSHSEVSIDISDQIESAITWRNDGDKAGSIVVFIQDESRKSHSLNELDQLTARDISRHLVSLAKLELSRNAPQETFWETLRGETANFPLSMLEDFVDSVSDDKDDIEAIVKNLWRLGLIRDAHILTPGQSAKDRLQRNRELIEKMGQLTIESRRRIALVLSKSGEDEQANRLRRGFELIRSFSFRGDKDVLKELDFETVDILLQAGSKLPKSSPVPVAEKPVADSSGETDDSNEGRDTKDEGTSTGRPLQGKALQSKLAEWAMSGDEKSRGALRGIGEAYLSTLLDDQSQENADHIASPDALAGQEVRFTTPHVGLRKVLGMVCTRELWGGVLSSAHESLKDAINKALPDDLVGFNPDDASQGKAGHCLFSFLRRFDEVVEDGVSFSAILDRLTNARASLAEKIDLVLSYPVVLFGGFPDAERALDEYLDAYTDLLSAFRSNEPNLHKEDEWATKFVAAELVRLDTVYVHCGTQTDKQAWKAFLTPLHPIHLWRYREILRSVQPSQEPRSEDDLHTLSESLPNLPHLLHYLVLSQNVAAGAPVLPHSGQIDSLPTYENHTNRYLGDDGVEFVNELLVRWLEYAPYTASQVRLAIVDAPNMHLVLKEIARFLDKRRGSSVVLQSYQINRLSAASELSQLEYESDDNDIAELMRSGRLRLHLQAMESITEVTTDLECRPVHVLYVFDQSRYQVDYGPSSKGLIVSPLVVTYEYNYNRIVERGTIAPSSDAQEGIFSNYHFLAERAGNFPAGQQSRLILAPEDDLQPVCDLLSTDATRWLAIADRSLNDYAPVNAIPLGQRRLERREIGVWAKASDRTVGRFLSLLHQYNVSPNPDVLTELLQRHGHIATDGIASLSIVSANSNNDAGQKGFLGKLFAAEWYVTRYPDALIASLDSGLARQWLQGMETSERADLIGLRFEDGMLLVEAIEVKTRSDSADYYIVKDAGSGQNSLAGHAVVQLNSVLEALELVFAPGVDKSLTTAARREVLRYQLYRECFHRVHEPEFKKRWFERLEMAFAQPVPQIDLQCRGLVVHMNLKVPMDQEVTEYSHQALSLVSLGTKAIQRLLVHAQEGSATVEDKLESEPSRNPVHDETSSQQDASPIHPGSPQPASAPDNNALRSADVGPRSAPIREPSIGSGTFSNTLHVARSIEVAELGRKFLLGCEAYRIKVAECNADRAITGPNVYRFYVRLARGQRIDLLRNSLEDIGREMARSGLLISTVANSDEIALDIPRGSSDRENVPVSQGLAEIGVSSSPEQMPILIGISPEGDNIIRDLGTMPHLMVGGTTGSGKTIFLYGVLLSLIVSHPDPASLRLLVSTSKPEDFTFFGGLDHLEQGRIVSDADEAVHLLQDYVTKVFDERGQILQEARCRDIKEYNSRFASKLAPLVILVDEFADLADQLAYDRNAQKSFYTQLRRVAQLGRNRGVHLVLCTQRPSADLVPTSIRNLMNNRVALRVNDATASRMILEDLGAEQLQMHGDLLYRDDVGIIRGQGFFTTTDDLYHYLVGE